MRINKNMLHCLSAIVLSYSLVACGGNEIGDGSLAGSARSHGGPVIDYISLVDNLRAAGALVDPVGTVIQPFFDPVGQRIQVNGEDLQVFEFSSDGEADLASKTVSEDGRTIGNVSIQWVLPPHFYKAGKVIALYVGNDAGVLSLLEEVLGLQFAGG